MRKGGRKEDEGAGIRGGEAKSFALFYSISTLG
jgi:hypothetical protein